MSAAFVGCKGRDVETHCPAMILSRGRRDCGSHEGERRGEDTDKISDLKLVGGDGLEPPTLSV